MFINVMERPAEVNTDFWPGMHIHLVGIGGSGLSAIAELLLDRGYQVSGSDLKLNDRTDTLVKLGARIFKMHDAINVDGVDLVLVSSAIPETNPEIQEAKNNKIPVMKRAGFLGLLAREKMTVAIAGSHGKTTTTGMIAQLMIASGLDPSFIVGGILPSSDQSGHWGQGNHFVIEADEYDYMFLGLNPHIAVITNVEYDHPDLFNTPEIYRAAFARFIDRILPGGKLYACSDDPGVMVLLQTPETFGIEVKSYGIRSGEWRAQDLRTNAFGGTDFLVTFQEEVVGLVRLRIPGVHNVNNGLAAIAVTADLGVPFDSARRALAEFGGIGRRFQIVGDVADVVVVDDYAHHPTEIRVTLAAARERFPGRRIWAVWQPHTFSRIRSLKSEFATCFVDADRLVALDIFRSREKDRQGVDTTQVLETIEHPPADYVPQVEDAAEFILERIRPGDVVLTLTAGDGNLVGELILKELEKRVTNEK